MEIDIASGCDCTTLDYPKNKIKPGKKQRFMLLLIVVKRKNLRL
ncbi:MAG: hypothetical protein IPN89_09960 [Saprospiraceae bacterium]|nr:hypothetical protein [Saprospiraceae bacterium]